jgi:hypothetical protein
LLLLALGGCDTLVKVLDVVGLFNACLEGNVLLLGGCDTLVKVLDVVDLFNVYLMIYDHFKHIIRCHPLVVGVLADKAITL